ncbi:11120_t:CDS:2 [Paraglomus occultum]|uniref:11120_t:CDS:1 n=1 Tax=Paraglomus occultum TaxID=144539 RepID=A0A9N9CXP9_9GLOM|nr:11120_t:CDS:2 [Paraglomus occultum]
MFVARILTICHAKDFIEVVGVRCEPSVEIMSGGNAHEQNVHEQNRIWLENSITQKYVRYYKDEDLTDRDLIGRGGYALVYKASVKQCDINVAIKQLLPLPSTVAKEEIYSIFVRESSRNILIQSGVAKITDFGLAKLIEEQTATALGGTPAYMDPMCIKYPAYVRDKKSDIFSFGVVLWEISTGNPPYEGQTFIQVVSWRILNHREPPVSNTPEEYLQLYSECWHDDPNIRPTCDVVCDRLKELLNRGKEEDTYLSRTDSTSSESTLFSQGMKIERTPSMQTSQSTLISREMISKKKQIQFIKWTKPAAHQTLPQQVITFLRNELILGKHIDHIGASLLIWMKTNNHEISEIAKLLDKYKVNSAKNDSDKQDSSIRWLLGFMYQYGLGTEEDEIDAYDYYKESANANNYLGLYSIGRCFQTNYGAFGKLEMVIKFYSRSADQGFTPAIYNLADIYASAGDEKQAFTILKEIADQGDSTALCKLSSWYARGKGVTKSESEAINCLVRAVELGNPIAKCEFGVRLLYGQGGITKDERRAISLFMEACEFDIDVAYENLGNCYERGIGTDVNLQEAIKYYQLASRTARNESDRTRYYSAIASIEAKLKADYKYLEIVTR